MVAWTRPPSTDIQLNKGHWLADGLMYWYPTPQSADRWIDYSGYNRGAVTLNSGTSPMVVTSQGNRAIDLLTGASEFSSSDVSAIAGADYSTIAFWSKSTGYTANTTALAISKGSSTGSLLAIYPFETTNGNGIRIYWNGQTVLNQNTGAASLNEWHHFVFTSRSLTDHEVYVDGVSVDTSNASKDIAFDATHIDIGHWNSTANGDVQIKDITIHNRGMTSGEVASWYEPQNRWALYQPKPRFAFTDVPADVRLLTAPKPWTKQPPVGTPIDWSNPLTKGLFRANIPSGPYSVNNVSGQQDALVAGTYSTGTSRVGRVQYGSEPAAQTSLTVYATDNLFKTHVDNVFTMAGLVYLPSNYASPAMVFGEGGAVSGSNISMVRTSNFTHAWETRLRASFAGPIFSTTTDAVDAVAGGIYFIVASMNRNAPTDKGLLDVYRLDTGAYERVTSADDIGTDFTGYNSFSFGLGSIAGLALQLTWNRELSKGERDSLAAQPWQIFEPQSIYATYPYVPPEEGGPDGRDRLFTFKKEWK